MPDSPNRCVVWYAGAMSSELELVSYNLLGNARKILRWARQLTPEQLDFTYSPSAPTARNLVIHTWQWLACDRQHIEQPDASQHALILEAPADPEALFAEFEAELDRWQALLAGLTEEKLAEPRSQFNDTSYPWSVRDALYHMLQNVLYKLGQFSYLYYAFGLDGTAPYEAPFPNPIYKEVFGGT
jgi:DinB superfamily